jgi:phenylalanyl-tRNA synthetase alpha subunit
MGNRIKYISLALIAGIGISGAVSAATVNSVVSAEQSKLKLAQQSQQRVDTLSDERRKLYNDFKAVSKEVEGLKIYNKQLSKQILNQRADMERIRNTIENVQITERQIPPLMLRMIEGLKQFIALDMPFLKDERQTRIDDIVEAMDKANITKAEKFRAITGAYKIEVEYGQSIETYNQSLEIDGKERNVTILRFGRIAMVYQTTDGSYSGFWNKSTGQWEPLDSGADRSNIEEAIKIAEKQSAPDLITLPVPAAEAVQ